MKFKKKILEHLIETLRVINTYSCFEKRKYMDFILYFQKCVF